MVRTLGFSALIFLCLPSRGQDFATAHLSDTARLFGKDVISNGEFCFNTSFTRDGHTVFFSRATANWENITIYASTEKHSEWSHPEPVAFTGKYRDTDPFVSPDGRRFYFCSDRPLEGKPYVQFDYTLFCVPLDGRNPGVDPVPVRVPLPEGVHILYPSFAENGDLYFASFDSLRDSDIWCAHFVDGAYQTPERLPFNDPKVVDFDPVIAKDESFLIFSSTRPKGFGGVDLWISFREGDSWSTPLNLGPKVNSSGNDGAPGLSPDNKKLYFCSSREKKPGSMPQIYEIDISDLISFLHAK